MFFLPLSIPAPKNLAEKSSVRRELLTKGEKIKKVLILKQNCGRISHRVGKWGCEALFRCILFILLFSIFIFRKENDMAKYNKMSIEDIDVQGKKCLVRAISTSP